MGKIENPVTVETAEAPEGTGEPAKVKRVSIRVADREIPLRYDTRVQIQIEDELEMDFYELNEKLNKGRRNTKVILTALRLMGNEGLRKAGQEPDLTEDWLLDNIVPEYMLNYRIAAMGAMVAGWYMETDDSFNEKHDVVLDEIRKKNGSTESPAGS